jgi:DNA modification methylase
MPAMPQYKVVPIDSLIPYAGNAKRHPKEQIRKLVESIREFGFLAPIVADQQNNVLAGHGRLLAAQQLELPAVPVLLCDHLTPAQVRAYRLADNRIAEDAPWDPALLKVELEYLMQYDFKMEATGFSVCEIDQALTVEIDNADEEPETPDLPGAAETVSLLGDVWELHRHRVVCGDARDPKVVQSLMENEQARQVLTDPPYDVKIQGHVSGLGKHQHAEFAMASGEMSDAEFSQFLTDAIGASVTAVVDGGLVFAFMDWRHLVQLHQAATAVGLQHINLAVWVKSNGGMGSLYRSQHELVWMGKKGKAPHINNVQLGRDGRYRTNVWHYRGMNAFGDDRDASLAMHPTVKPVSLLADAILDVTRPKDIVLDPFLGSGSTLMAAERTHRRGYGIEIDPRYVDVVLMRWMKQTGLSPIHVASGKTFEQMRATRVTSVEA